MYNDTEILNPLTYPEWDRVLISNPGHIFFHTSAWARVLWESYDYRPVYFTLVDERRLLALMPMMEVRSVLTGLRGVSLPFTDYCEPLLNEGYAIEDLMDSVKEYARKHHWKFIEIRGADFPGITPSTSHYRHRLNLNPSPAELFSGLGANTRRNIKKAVREGVEVNIFKSLEAVEKYYRLHCMTRKRHGLPPQPLRFFKKLYEHVISKDLGFIVLASYNKTNICGAVYLLFGDKAIYKFGASDYTYQHLRANNLVMWEAIKWCARNSYQYLCMGRTALDNTGLRRFKNGWGTAEEIIKYYRYDLRRSAFVSKAPFARGFHSRMFQVIPIPISRMLGSILYKHVG